MRRLAFLLSLLAALAGSPLRQAEAAADFSRVFADFTPNADLEAPDGGVGDDSDLGTLTDSHEHAVDVAVGVVLFLLPPPSNFIATPAADKGFGERVWWPQSPPATRFAWLQSFRF